MSRMQTTYTVLMKYVLTTWK